MFDGGAIVFAILKFPAAVTVGGDDTLLESKMSTRRARQSLFIPVQEGSDEGIERNGGLNFGWPVGEGIAEDRKNSNGLFEGPGRKLKGVTFGKVPSYPSLES
jgi:hypothetical protein